MRRAARALAGALLAALSTACGGAEPSWVDGLPARAPAGPPVDARGSWVDLLALTPRPIAGAAPAVRRVELAPGGAPESEAQEMRRSRDGVVRVVSDERRAWVVETGAEFRVDLPRGGSLSLALALVPGSDGALPPGSARVTVERMSEDGESRASARELAGATLSGSASWELIAPQHPVEGTLSFAVEGPPGLAVALAEPALLVAPSRAPEVLVISVDTLRADRLGFAGYGRGTSPSLDRLAASGVVFERCTSPAPWTLPSYGSLFTGLHPTEHRAGVTARGRAWGGGEADDGRGTEALSGEVATLAELLSAAGWRTCGIYFNPYLSPRSGLSRGFDRWIGGQYDARAAVELARSWRAEHQPFPRFLFLQLIDPHWPYAPPAPFDRRFAGRSVDDLKGYPWSMQGLRKAPPGEERRRLLSDLYDGEVAHVDAELGRLLDAMRASGDLARALVVLHSDHGEELWDHGGFEHGHSLHAELLHVPLVVAYPPLLAPRRVGASVRALDVLPTVLDLLGLAPPPGIAGTSLVPFARGEVPGVQLTAFSESILWGKPWAPFDEAKALQDDGYKVIVGDGGAAPLLFGADDRREERDLAAEEPRELARLRGLLEARWRQLSAGARASGDLELDAAERARLQQIGYAGDER